MAVLRTPAATDLSRRLFVCLFGVFRATRNFYTHLETSPLPVKDANCDLCSALMAIEQ